MFSSATQKLSIVVSPCTVIFAKYRLLTVTGESSPTDHTIKPKLRIIEAAGDNNNKKKFQFLSAETTPGNCLTGVINCHLSLLFLDYRSKDAQDEKSKKTSTNESTKFQQQQQRKDIFKDLNGKNPILTEQEVSREIFN